MLYAKCVKSSRAIRSRCGVVVYVTAIVYRASEETWVNVVFSNTLHSRMQQLPSDIRFAG